MNNNDGMRQPVKVSVKDAAPTAKNTTKNVKGMVLSYILCTFLTAISNKIVSIFSIFFVVLCFLEFFCNKKCILSAKPAL